MVWSKSVSITGEKEDLAIPLPLRMPGGAFVTASVVRPLDTKSSEWKPYRAYGIVRLATDFTEREIELDLRLPRETRPGAEVVVKVGSNLSEGRCVRPPLGGGRGDLVGNSIQHALPG